MQEIHFSNHVKYVVLWFGKILLSKISSLKNCVRLLWDKSLAIFFLTPFVKDKSKPWYIQSLPNLKIYKLYDLLVQHVTDIFMVVKFLFSCFSLASILSSYLKQFHKDHSFYPQTYFIFHYLWNGGFDQFFWRGGLDGKGEGNNFWSWVRVFRGTSVPLQQGGIRKTSKRLQIRNDNISSWLKLIFGKKKNIFLVTL